MIETYRGTIYPWHCDHMGHMNVQYYAARFDEATWQLFHYLGITLQYMNEYSRGMAAVEQTTKYMQELVPGDLVSVSSKVLSVQKKVIIFQHTMKKDESISAETTITSVHIDQVKRKSCEFPEELFHNILNKVE